MADEHSRAVDSRGALWPAFAYGAAAALIGGTVLVTGTKDPPFSAWAVVSGPLLFVACFGAAYTTRRGWFAALGAVLGGVVAGYTVQVIVHASLFGGSRTLWPFEIALFLGMGFVPALAGALLGALAGKRERR